jgi:hypothetical protein
VPPAYKANKPQRLIDQNHQSPPYEATRAPIVVRPLSRSPRKALCFLLFSASEDHSIASARRVKPRSAGGPQLRKSGGTELRKSGGTHPKKSGGSDQRKFCSRAKREPKIFFATIGVPFANVSNTNICRMCKSCITIVYLSQRRCATLVRRCSATRPLPRALGALSWIRNGLAVSH